MTHNIFNRYLSRRISAAVAGIRTERKQAYKKKDGDQAYFFQQVSPSEKIRQSTTFIAAKY